MQKSFLDCLSIMTYFYIDRQHPLILASASARRKELLFQLQIPFLSQESRVAEECPSDNPLQTACLLAERKAKAVGSSIEGSWILGADTIVVVPNGGMDHMVDLPAYTEVVLGKPTDEAEARRMLCQLSGRQHRVITGFCILDPKGRTAHVEAVTSKVDFKALTDSELEAYIATKEPYGKAGGYAIQGIGSFLVRNIFGSYTNIVGLPLYEVITALVSIGAIKSFPLPGN